MLYTKPNNWTKEQWLSATKKIKTLSCRKTAHWDAYYYNSRRDRWVNIPIILISSFIGATALSQSGETSEEASVYPYYVISGLSVINTMLTSINKYFSYGEMKEAHKGSAFNYLELRCELTEMIEKRDSQGNCPSTYDQFNELYYKKMTNVRENSPILPNFIKESMDLNVDDKVEKLEKKIDTYNVVIDIADTSL